MAVLEACGRAYHLGPLGSGEVAKACNQLIVAAAVLALGEAAVLADRSGLELDTLFELFAGGYADSRILRTPGSGWSPTTSALRGRGQSPGHRCRQNTSRP